MSTGDAAADTEAALERSAAHLTPEALAELRTMAAAAGLSVGAFLKRTMDMLDPELAASVHSLDSMARRLDTQSKQAMAAIEEAGAMADAAKQRRGG